MPQFTVYGEVIGTIAKDLGMRVENAVELRDFCQSNHVDTKLDWFGSGPPVMSINRRQDLAVCKLGDRVSLTMTTEDRRRRDGRPFRGLRTVDFTVISRGS